MEPGVSSDSVARIVVPAWYLAVQGPEERDQIDHLHFATLRQHLHRIPPCFPKRGPGGLYQIEPDGKELPLDRAVVRYMPRSGV